MKFLDQVAYALFLLALGLAIGWLGIPSMVKWRDKDAFCRATTNSSGGLSAHVLAVIRYRPDILVIGLLVVALALKALYEVSNR